MAGTTFADRLDVTEDVADWFEKHAVELRKMGIDPEFWKTNLRSSITAARTANTIQEGMKAQLKDQTVTVNKTDRYMYVLGSSAIDVLSGTYGKDSPQAAQIRRFRSKLHKPPATPANPK